MRLSSANLYDQNGAVVLGPDVLTMSPAYLGNLRKITTALTKQAFSASSSADQHQALAALNDLLQWNTALRLDGRSRRTRPVIEDFSAARVHYSSNWTGREGYNGHFKPSELVVSFTLAGVDRFVEKRVPYIDEPVFTHGELRECPLIRNL